MFNLIKKFLAAVLPGVIKPLRVLWNEIIGFLFMAFAVLLIRPVWQSYKSLDSDPANFARLLLSALFFLIMLGFGIHSFVRARKISRS